MEEFKSRMQERRKHERLERNFTLRYSTLHDLSECLPEKEAELLDISGGGIRFLTKERLENGRKLIVELEIPGWQVKGGDWSPTANRNDIGRLKVIGKVIWTAPSVQRPGWYETGLRFTGQLR